MAQPTPYNRLYDFSDYQEVNPTKPLRGSEVDAEFDAIKLTTDQIRANAALIQRDDGSLANQSVTPDSLSAGTLAMIHQGEYLPRGAWVATTAYAMGDLVTYNAATYLCIAAHTAQAAFPNDLAANRWLLIANGALSGQASAIDLFEGNAATTTYTLSYTYANSNAAVVFVGGVALIPVQDFTISGTTLTFVVAPPAPSVAGRKNVMVRGTGIEAQLAANAAAAAATDAQGFASAASGSASAAATSATAAAGSASAASTSATNAANSATSSANSASTATTQATSATNSATAAAGSATAAAGSATTAGNSATTATNKANEAASSATAAAASATAAAGSAATATNKAGEATTAAAAAAGSQTAAASSASSAGTSATNANNSATSASNSATSATSSASSASSSASSASTSASTATTKASEASTSATNAATSATSAASSASSASASATSATNSAAAAATSETNAASSASSAAASAAAAATFDPAVYLSKAGNLSGLANTATARDNLGVKIGADVQAYDANLTSLANKGLFKKVDSTIVAWTKTGAGTATSATTIYIDVNGSIKTIASGASITMPTLTAGTDYAIWAKTDGTLEATSNHTSPPTANARKVGGFHYAAGSNATGTSGGNTTAQINEYSFWDLKFKPSCADPRGMTLVGGAYWMDIYLTGVDAITNGSSKYSVTMADGSSPPKVPTMFGGNGSTTYGTYTWFEAMELATAFGKRCPTQREFMSAMYGTTEASSVGSDQGSTVLNAAYTSKWGCVQSTGVLWVWGDDRGGAYNTGGWNANTESRGSEYNAPNAVLLGGYWGDGAFSGSRCSVWGDAASGSYFSVGSRFCCDHLQLD